MLNETHRSDLRSWVDSANDPATDFPIQNLPLGIVRPRGGAPREPWRVGAAIGSCVVDLAAAAHSGLLEGGASRAGARCAAASLNGLMALDPAHWTALRVQLSRLLRADTPEGERARRLRQAVLLDVADVEVTLPAEIGDYTDFYASRHHALNVGKMLRPDQPLLPNYAWVPIGYHGRASSIVVSGTPVRRPRGQRAPDGQGTPVFAPSARLDYEAEVGFFVGTGNALGEPVPIERAARYLFGASLLNDWSARDIQAWEYQPLGPFLAKSFATTLSPWVVTMDALAPFRVAASPRAAGDPAPLPYLTAPEDAAEGGIDVRIEVLLRTARMRREGVPAARLSRGTLAELYWTPAQLLTHHTSNGCNLRPGDLLGSGTVSGPTREQRGCLLELTWRGAEPLALPTGEERRFLEDGDEVILRGSCEREGFARIGFGECSGVVMAPPAVTGDG
ncbi:MAG TPA: fumarylacetoacetase [Gemmatimonadaceae bacterium]|nr:fumarylacetoacetase [Gemmatimonadaceae bacterium]